MTEQYEPNGSRFWIKLMIRIGMLVFLILIWWGIGEFVADLLILYKITWLRLSTTTMLIVGLGGFVSMIVADRMIDRLFHLYKNVPKGEGKGNPYLPPSHPDAKPKEGNKFE